MERWSVEKEFPYSTITPVRHYSITPNHLNTKTNTWAGIIFGIAMMLQYIPAQILIIHDFF